MVSHDRIGSSLYPSSPEAVVELHAVGKKPPFPREIAQEIPSDGAIILCFPGQGHFNDKEYLSDDDLQKKYRLVADFFHHSELPDAPRNVYLLRRQKHRASSLEMGAVARHCREPDYANDAARYIVAKVFDPLVPDLIDSTDVKADFQTAARNFSRVLMVGHSLGTSYIQQVRNVLVDWLSAKGYDENQQETLLHALAAVSFGTVIPVRDRGSKDLPTLHAVMQGDRVAEENTNNNQIVGSSDTHPHIAVMRCGTHLYLRPNQWNKRYTRLARLKPAEDGLDMEHPQSRLPKTDTPQWNVHVSEKYLSDAHHERLVYNTNRPVAPLASTFQTSVGADAVQHFIAEALLASERAMKEGTVRDTSLLLSSLQKQQLSEAGRQSSVAKVQAGDEYLRSLAELAESQGNPVRRR